MDDAEILAGLTILADAMREDGAWGNTQHTVTRYAYRIEL